MTKQFHAQIEMLRRSVLTMGAEARQNLIDGVRSLVSDDPALAANVVSRKDVLNRMDVELERDALDLLALNQPMAQDLRMIGASLKIITYLDRIGRYGYDIARIEQTLVDQEKQEGHKKHPRKPVAFQVMADGAIRMLDMALDAYANKDPAKARSVGKQDDVVDGLEDEIFRQCVTYMMEDPRTITACSHYILVARHLERAADNAAKIAEKTLYMATGERRLAV
jgi:phosphate transport system protein